MVISFCFSASQRETKKEVISAISACSAVKKEILHYQVMITVNGKKITWREGMTVADLLNDLNDSYTYIVVRINDKQVSRPDFDKALIPDNSKIFLVPMVAGG